MSFQPVRASAPGKIILAGEHAVVHGTRALATVIDKRTFATVAPNANQPDTVLLIFHQQPQQRTDGGPSTTPSPVTYSWPLSSLQRITATHISAVFPPPSSPVSVEADRDALDATQSALSALLSPSASAFARSRLVFLLYFCFLYRARTAVVCELRSELPISAGLGSSASFCAALATALYALVGTSPPSAPLSGAQLALINAWAYEGERVLHGTPSGVDNTSVVYGGVILYQRGAPMTQLPRLGRERWLIVNTRQERDTRLLVEGVGRRLRAEPQRYRPMIDRIDAIVGDCIELITRTTPATPLSAALSPLLLELQDLLSALGVSHPTVDAVVAVAAAHGVAAKLTGAGGGGCVLCLLKDSMSAGELAAMRREMEQRGFECLEAAVGQGGAEVALAAPPGKL